jgi:hypothetical protein
VECEGSRKAVVVRFRMGLIRLHFLSLKFEDFYFIFLICLGLMYLVLLVRYFCKLCARVLLYK